MNRFRGAPGGRCVRRCTVAGTRSFPTRRRDEEGVLLLDAAIAAIVLLIAFVPISSLLASTNQVGATDQQKVAGSALAESWVSSAQTTVASPAYYSTIPPSLISNSQLTTGAASLTIEPVSNEFTSGSGQSTSVENTTYTAFAVGGWCDDEAASTTYSWGSYVSTDSVIGVAYFVAIVVTWGLGTKSPSTATGADSTVVQTILPAQRDWPNELTSSATACPMSSTL